MRLVDGVHVVDEGPGRLRWKHEIAGQRAPLAGHEWQVGGLWPDASEAERLQSVVDRGEPLLVILDQRNPPVTLPVENLPTIPDGVVVEERFEDLLTIRVPELDWLPEADRRRGQLFADHARRALSQESPLRRTALMVESLDRGSRSIRFAVRATHVNDMILSSVIQSVFSSRQRRHSLARLTVPEPRVGQSSTRAHGAGVAAGVAIR